jgi:hypothetical protein
MKKIRFKMKNRKNGHLLSVNEFPLLNDNNGDLSENFHYLIIT